MDFLVPRSLTLHRYHYPMILYGPRLTGQFKHGISSTPSRDDQLPRSSANCPFGMCSIDVINSCKGQKRLDTSRTDSAPVCMAGVYPCFEPKANLANRERLG